MKAKTKKLTPKDGDLRVWWVPQVPMTAFRVPVATVLEAKLLLDTLAQYDLFQLRHNIKPDFANAGGLEVFDAADHEDGADGSWLCWYADDGREVDKFTLHELRDFTPAWEMDEVRKAAGE